jgi:hypothetical protein
VTGEQLIVLGLIAAAFVAGWFARGGAGARRVDDVTALVESGAASLQRTLTACRAAAATWLHGQQDEEAWGAALRILAEEVASLERVRGEAGERLGDGHPLVRELGNAAEAASLVAGELRGGDPAAPLLAAYQDVVASARTRYVRAANGARS